MRRGWDSSRPLPVVERRRRVDIPVAGCLPCHMLEYVGLGRRPLHTSFRIRSGARARILEFPGRWMPDAEQARLLSDLRAVVAGSVDRGALDYGVLTGDRDAWDRAVL